MWARPQRLLRAEFMPGRPLALQVDGKPVLKMNM